MNIVDIIFFIVFVILSICLFVFGLLSFYFRYTKLLKLKKKINANEIEVADKIRDVINSDFGMYKLVLSSSLMDKVNETAKKNKELRVLHKNYEYFKKLQLISLLLVAMIFVLYVASKIFISWTYRYNITAKHMNKNSNFSYTENQHTFLNTYMFYGDFAADYIYTIEDNPRADHLEKTLQKVASTSIYDYLESPDASEALVAAEAVAYLKGNPSPEATETFLEALDRFKTPDPNEIKYLEDQAIRAVNRVLAEQSELLDLWKESDEYDKWKKAANNLLERLSQK